jgi:hypothetical protein
MEGGPPVPDEPEATHLAVMGAGGGLRPGARHLGGE